MPWMVYTIFFLFANTALYMVYAAQYFTMDYKPNGAGIIVATLIYVCK